MLEKNQQKNNRKNMIIYMYFITESIQSVLSEMQLRKLVKKLRIVKVITTCYHMAYKWNGVLSNLDRPPNIDL